FFFFEEVPSKKKKSVPTFAPSALTERNIRRGNSWARRWASKDMEKASSDTDKASSDKEQDRPLLVEACRNLSFARSPLNCRAVPVLLLTVTVQKATS